MLHFRLGDLLSVRYKNFWPGFEFEDHLIKHIFEAEKRDLTILGPFERRGLLDRSLRGFGLEKISFFSGNKADFFVTGENRPPDFVRARKQIGFWRSYKQRADVFRFPYWMWYVDWPEIENQPKYLRYGMRLSIDRLMRPISATYSADQLSNRLNRAILFSQHLLEPRRRLFRLTDDTIGCDGFGGAFGNDNRQQPKMPAMENYRFSLCPENSIGDGYITEKIPESFHSGCIPITWARPEDISEDFNAGAIVNLFGLNNLDVNETLREVAGRGSVYSRLISEPLLLRKPNIEKLLAFIRS